MRHRRAHYRGRRIVATKSFAINQRISALVGRRIIEQEAESVGLNVFSNCLNGTDAGYPARVPNAQERRELIATRGAQGMPGVALDCRDTPVRHTHGLRNRTHDS